MREIKFRAWDSSRSEWHYFVIAPTDVNIDRTTSFGSLIHRHMFDYHLLENGSWCQYTGLTDKNGKEIYEGDIVRSTAEPGYRSQNGINVVYWDGVAAKWNLACEASYCKGYYNGLAFDWGGWSNHEVIGNIYENPDLCDVK